MRCGFIGNFTKEQLRGAPVSETYVLSLTPGFSEVAGYGADKTALSALLLAR
jgi:hypothetical protein